MKFKLRQKRKRKKERKSWREKKVSEIVRERPNEAKWKRGRKEYRERTREKKKVRQYGRERERRRENEIERKEEKGIDRQKEKGREENETCCVLKKKEIKNIECVCLSGKMGSNGEKQNQKETNEQIKTKGFKGGREISSDLK